MLNQTGSRTVLFFPRSRLLLSTFPGSYASLFPALDCFVFIFLYSNSSALSVKIIVHKCDKAYRDGGAIPSDRRDRRFTVLPGYKGVRMHWSEDNLYTPSKRHFVNCVPSLQALHNIVYNGYGLYTPSRIYVHIPSIKLPTFKPSEGEGRLCG